MGAKCKTPVVDFGVTVSVAFDDDEDRNKDNDDELALEAADSAERDAVALLPESSRLAFSRELPIDFRSLDETVSDPEPDINTADSDDEDDEKELLMLPVSPEPEPKFEFELSIGISTELKLEVVLEPFDDALKLEDPDAAETFPEKLPDDDMPTGPVVL
ncbi:hypothetical protein PHYBOEH_007826 [Phytophthora boehmeriae]|uniref:Uncharacterized protein n=1 Tax=Phytophthora boehmeriae TaxID=109152 RepID=A0A8T1X122_9STRA|nr:hypothetical protein PHYBOEH_007826 [Phytophthora boehmeriae]